MDFEDRLEKYAMIGISNDDLLFVALGKGGFPLYLQYHTTHFYFKLILTLQDISIPVICHFWELLCLVTYGQSQSAEVITNLAKWIKVPTTENGLLMLCGY